MNKHVAILMMSSKLVTLSLLKIEAFWNKGYDVIIFVQDVPNKRLSHDSKYIVSFLKWAKFGHSSLEKSYHNLDFIRVWPEKQILLEGCSWFKFNNPGLALGMTWNVYSCVAKGLKLTVRWFLGLISTCMEVAGEAFLPHLPFPRKSWIGLKDE